jgi:hypothetical protein
MVGEEHPPTLSPRCLWFPLGHTPDNRAGLWPHSFAHEKSLKVEAKAVVRVVYTKPHTNQGPHIEALASVDAL